MATKGEKLRAKRARNQKPDARTEEVTRRPERPTPQRMARGKWAEPTGIAKHTSPIVDLTCDMIGRLYVERQITSEQEQAARTFQQVRAEYVEQLGVTGYRSCIAESQSGYDSSDGNPAAVAAYKAICKRLGLIHTQLLVRECAKGPKGKVIQLDALRQALDKIAGW